MTGPADDTLTRDSINLLLENGLADGLPHIAGLLINTAMIIGRSAHLQAEPHHPTQNLNTSTILLNPIYRKNVARP